MNYAYLLKETASFTNQKAQVEVVLRQEIWSLILATAVKTIKVKEDWYLQFYDDVRRAVIAGQADSARDHYFRYGYYENRLPFPIQVDEDFYLQAYPDVKAAVDAGVFASAQDHFQTAGYGEGRLPFPSFSLFDSTD